jgi:hypothetical protein
MQSRVIAPEPCVGEMLDSIFNVNAHTGTGEILNPHAALRRKIVLIWEITYVYV